MNHFIIIFSAVLVAAHCEVNQVPVAADKLSLLNQKKAECEAEYKLSTTINVMLKKRLNGEPINGDEFKNALYCMVTKINTVDEHGHFVIDEVLTYYPSSVDKDLIRTVLEDCNSKFAVTDPKEMFMSIFDCYINSSPTILATPSD